MFLGWYDPDKKYPTRLKLAEAIERYVEKFGQPPLACLTHPTEAAELGADPEAPRIEIHAVAFLPRHTFYIGEEDQPAAVLAA